MAVCQANKDELSNVGGEKQDLIGFHRRKRAQRGD